MSNYRRGRSAENYLKRRLIKTGYRVFRLAGSKPADLIAVDAREILLIEVRSYRLTKGQFQREATKLFEICKDTPMKPCIIHKPDGKRYKMFELQGALEEAE